MITVPGRVSENLAHSYARAKYYRTPDGVLKLAKIQYLSFPVFRLPGYESEEKKKTEIDEMFSDMETEVSVSAVPALYDEGASPTEDSAKDRRNAWKDLNRAKVNAFDKILCNPDLDTFATFTISPEQVRDRTAWEDVYGRVRNWLSDRVKRRGLKYVICPERHKKGGIHFHAIMNAAALRLSPATNAHTGEPLMHDGKPLYNIRDFPFGFTSAERIQSATLDREKVAKYIFKYMGKQGTEGKIGGRYALIGGKLTAPVYLYGDNPEDFFPGSEGNARQDGYYREAVHEGIRYKEWSFI